MTYNEKKRFLEGYVYSVRRIKGLQRELEEWQTIATGITQKLKDIPIRSSGNNKIEDCAIKMAELENQLYDEIEKATQKRESIQIVVNQIRDLRRREIIELRYVHGLSVNMISYELDKDCENIYKIIRRTIKSLEIKENPLA